MKHLHPMDSLVYIDGVLTSHNFIDGRSPLLLVGFLHHLAKERKKSQKIIFFT